MNHFARVLASGPIRWRPWTEATLTAAAEADRLILLLIGSAVDHWSTAFAAELIADAEACAVIDELFIPVHAETLADPALAVRVQQVLALTADARGWPAALICLPDGRPVGATPWRPIRDRDRRQGLLPLLLAIAEAWVERPADLIADAERLASTLHQAQQRQVGATLPSPTLLLDTVEAAAMAVADPLNGGFGPPPRGCDAVLTRFLLARSRREGAPLTLARQVERHLAAVVAGGIHDQFGGGFHRACADLAWREPFAEKRLLDNALMAWALADGAVILQQPLHGAVAERTLRWCCTALLRPDGLPSTARHASTAAGDGACYRWTVDQVADVIGEAGATVIATRFGLDDEPRVPAVVAPIPAADQASVPALLQRLAVARSERPQPPLDDRLDPAAIGALLAAGAALRQGGILPGDLEPTLQAIANRFATDGRSDLPAQALHRAWMALGLADWQPKAAHACYAAIGDGLQDDPVPGLVPNPTAAVDGPDGPGLPGVHAWAALALGDEATARRCITDHAGLLRQAPLAAASLALALDRLTP